MGSLYSRNSTVLEPQVWPPEKVGAVSTSKPLCLYSPCCCCCRPAEYPAAVSASGHSPIAVQSVQARKLVRLSCSGLQASPGHACGFVTLSNGGSSRCRCSFINRLIGDVKAEVPGQEHYTEPRREGGMLMMVARHTQCLQNGKQPCVHYRYCVLLYTYV